MELNQLKCFYETMRLGNMTRAAESLLISQPALSIAIKKLEDELGVALFIRNGKRISPSAYGTNILPYVQKILSYEQEIISSCQNLHIHEKTISVNVLAASSVLPQIVPGFHVKYPDIDIKLLQENEPSSEPDIIISASIKKPQDVNAVVVLEEQIMIAVPNDHEFAAQESIKLTDLKNYQLIGLKKGQVMREIEDYYCARANMELSHAIECDSPAILRSLISSGAGIAFVAEKTWFFQNQSAFRLIPLDGLKWTRYIVIRKTRFRNNEALVQLFLNYASNFFSNL